MSTEELVSAYTYGRISRRTLVRRLVAGGLSFGAAVSYAHLLGQERAEGAVRDQYGSIELTGKILKQDLDRVIDRERVKVRYSVPKKAQVEFRIWLKRPERETGAYALIGQRTLQTDGPVKGKVASVPLDVNPPCSVDALRPLDPADLDLLTVARRNREPAWGYYFHQRSLTKEP